MIGTWFYIMDHVEGRIFWDAAFPEVGADVRRKYFDAMNEALAALHLVDFAAVGLGDFGKPTAYMSRQIARWSKQYLHDEAAGRVEAMDRLMAWLPAHLPAGDEAALVHGDFRCDNLIFHPTEPRFNACPTMRAPLIGNARSFGARAGAAAHSAGRSHHRV